MDGATIEGEFLGDSIDGFGTYTWPDGRIYEGFWLNNKQHGEAVFTSAKQQVKRGRWEKGKRVEWYEDGRHFAWEE